MNIEPTINSVLINGKRWIPAPEPQPERAPDLADSLVTYSVSNNTAISLLYGPSGGAGFHVERGPYPDPRDRDFVANAIRKTLRHYARELVRRAEAEVPGDPDLIPAFFAGVTRFKAAILSQIKKSQ